MQTDNSIIYKQIKPLGSDSNHESESVKSSDGHQLYLLYKIIFFSSLIRIHSMNIMFNRIRKGIIENEKEKGNEKRKIARPFFAALLGCGASPQLLKGAVRTQHNPARGYRPSAGTATGPRYVAQHAREKKKGINGAPIRRIRPGFETLRLSVFPSVCLISEKAICVRLIYL
jgi:hypothetical protein